MDYRSSSMLPSSSSAMGDYPLPSQPSDFSIKERARQIKTLRIFNENVTELSANLQYRVDFNGEEGNPLSLFLVLGPYFPMQPPEIYLSPPPSHHPWTDPTGRVIAAPGLLAYNALHTDLGRLVQAIKRQFQLTPLSVTPHSNGTTSFSSPVSAVNSSSTSPPPKTNSFYPTHQSRQQEETIYFPELSNLSLEKLKELNSDPTSLKYYYKTESSTRVRSLTRHDEEKASLKSELASIQSINENLSSSLKELTHGLQDKKTELESLKSELISQTETYVCLKKEMGGLPEACDKFRKAGLQKEDESDRIAEQFLDGEFEGVDVFLKEYFNSRNEYHLRKSQTEKMMEQIRKKNNFPF